MNRPVVCARKTGTQPIQSTRPTVSEHHFRRFAICAILALTLIFALSGCSNRAHNDLYQQRMASEIRVLEDQLYDADYQNRVLRDKLSQCKPREESAKAATSSADAQRTPTPVSPEKSDSEEYSDMDDGFESLDDLSLPSLDEGEPFEPGALTDPGTPLDDNGSGEDSADMSDLLPPAPGGPEPPGKRDTEIPQIDRGEILPPPAADDGGEPKPPGQINLPDSVQAATGVPAKLRVHPGLSGGYRENENIEDMVIVLHVVDSLGKPVNMDDFDIDAQLSIVILDPELEPSEARVGIWEFTAWQVANFIKSDPVSGLHVPIKWQGAQPSGEEMIVHARLRTEDEEMRCEGQLNVLKRPAIAQWTPRGDEQKR